MQISILRDAMAAAHFEQLRLQHPHLSLRVLSPEAVGRPTSGMDELHKLKDLVRALVNATGSGQTLQQLVAAEQAQRPQGQRAGVVAAADLGDIGPAGDGNGLAAAEEAGGDHCGSGDGCKFMGKTLMRAVVLSLCSNWDQLPAAEQKLSLPSPHVLLRLLDGFTDEQHVRSAQAFMGSSEVRACLDQHGFHKESLFMRVIHDAVEAVDARGLTCPLRTECLELRSELLRMQLGNRLFFPHWPLPKFIDGMTTVQILSMLGNADSRLQMLQKLPPAMQHLMCERATMQTYMVESLFGDVRQRAGFKPGADVLDGMMANIAWGHEQRSMTREERGYDLPADSKTNIYGRSVESGAPETWNDGSYPARQLARRRDVSSAAASVASVKIETVRSHFKT